MLRFCALIASALLISFASLAHGQEHKGVLYAKPKGWSEAAQGEAKVLMPSDLKEGEIVFVLITPAVPATAEPPAKQFESAVDRANEGAKVLSKGSIESQSAEGATVQFQVMELDSREFGKHSRIYAMILVGKQKTFAVVIVNKDSLMERHGEAITSLIGSLKFKDVLPTTGPTTAKRAGKIPTGNTPDLFPGSIGWLPSGVGVPIPEAAIVNGLPQGLWWKVQSSNNGSLKPITHIYLPDGVRASNPRPGGGNLFDVEGQRRQKGSTGVGTFSITNGQLVEKYDGFQNKGAYLTGSDKDGKFFKIGAAMFRPLVPLTKDSLVGTWRTTGTEYKFKADGTYEMGTLVDTGDWSAGSRATGKYVIDGYLLMFIPNDGGPMYIDRAGMGGLMLVKGSTFFVRKS